MDLAVTCMAIVDGFGPTGIGQAYWLSSIYPDTGRHAIHKLSRGRNPSA